MSTVDAILATHTEQIHNNGRRIAVTETRLDKVEQEVVAIKISLAKVAGAAAAGGLGGGGALLGLAKLLGIV